MAAATTVIAAVGAAAAVAGAGYSIHQGERSRSDQKKALKTAEKKQNQLAVANQKKIANKDAQSKAAAERSQSVNKQRRAASANQGRSSTILAGGSANSGGSVQGQSTAGKTILGL